LPVDKYPVKAIPGAPMEKLIITVACDSRTSYPHNHLCPTQEDVPGVAQQYIDAVNAGAAIAHIHGRRTLEETIQADGRQVSRIHHADWKRLQDAIMNKVDPIMQFGVASARIEEKIKLMELGPDMMAVCFNAHDEYFQPEPSLPPKRMMAIHPVEELIAYAKAAEEHKVKLECECFTTGAFWHLEFVRKQGYLRDKTYTTLFIGWPGGTWTPPTERALQFMVDNLPQNCIWNVSVMNPEKQWSILALAVALGGHVRVGYEDNPYMAPGEFARNNAVLVERMVGIARSLGREIATPDEARRILGLTRAQ
jgi:3-keto-5-aminohexanoate cleavage enzyme